jgi:hypothetical protein
MGILYYSPRRNSKMPPRWQEEFFVLTSRPCIGDHYSFCGVPEIVDLRSEIAKQSSAKRKAEAKLAAVDEVKIISVLLIMFSY